MKFNRINIMTWEKTGQRAAYGLAACELPAVDDRCVALTADSVRASNLGRFADKFPDRLYNVGIAEQNLIGVAAGMAKEGYIPFVSTFAVFAAARCFDQIRLSMGLMDLPIKLVGLAAGFSVGAAGPTHYALEDVALLRAIPGLTILSPADGTETVKATLTAATWPGPVYIRLTGALPNPTVYHEDYDFEIGKAIKLREGVDVSILATGSMVHQSLSAAELLAEKGISCAVWDVHTLKPLDETVVDEASKAGLIVTAEEHSVIGGLGDAVATVIAQKGYGVPLMKIGVEDSSTKAAGYQAQLAHHGFTARQMANGIKTRFD